MKKLIFILSFFLLNSAYAQDINLLCDISLSENKIGKITSQKIKTRVEITDNKDGNVWIIPDSNLIGSTSTIKHLNTTNVINRSNLTKWHIEKSSTLQDSNGTSHHTFIIDRNSGTISYDSTIKIDNLGSVHTTGFGNCEKIDTNKRKF